VPAATAAPGTARTGRLRLVALALLVPVAGLLLLMAQPSLDGRWQHQPAHFWLVLAAGGLNAALAYATSATARRRGDARVFLVSIAFLVAAGFLGLHALATPRVLLDQPNAGFTLATPVGLTLAALPAAASTLVAQGDRARAVMRHAGAVRAAVLAVLAAWAAWSLAELPPLDDPTPPERLSGPFVAMAVAGGALYGWTVVHYVRLHLRRGAGLLLALAAAMALLAEAMAAVALGRSWHASWWEWHVLMLAAFALIAVGAQREWHEERFADLYVDDPSGTRRDVSVLFADLAGFTSFSEARGPDETARMLNAYLRVAVPEVVARHGGEVDRIIGDAVMAVFNGRGDQPDHARRAARAALDLQEATSALADANPGWPRFRVGVNSGEVSVTVLGTAGGRTRSVVGDTVNLAARLESAAPVGGVLIGPETARRLGPARLEAVGALRVKGRRAEVDAMRLLDVDA